MINPQVSLYALCLLSIVFGLGSSMSIDIVTSGSTVSAISNYTFTMQNVDAVDFPTGTVIKIYLPINYQGVIAQGTYDCSSLVWFEPVSLTCSITGLTLSITGGFVNARPFDPMSTSFDTYKIKVQALTNPPYAQYTDIWTGQFVDSAATQIVYMESAGGFGVEITAGTLGCSISLSPTTVSSRSIMTVTITPSHNVPVDGKLVITSQTYWTRDSRRISQIFDSSLQCHNSTGSAANLGCVLDSTTSSTERTITVTNIMTVAAATQFSFTMSPVNNPPTTEPQGVFSMKTQSSLGSLIDECSSLKVSGMTAGQLSSPSFSMSSTVVNSVGQGNVTFRLSSPLLITDTISITFPSTLTLSLTSLFLSTDSRTITSYTVSGQTVTFNGTGVTVYPANTRMVILFTSIVNPPSTEITGTFSIFTRRSNYDIDYLAQSLVYQATAGQLTASLSSSTLEVGATARYTLTITLTNSITASAYLYITFPVAFDLTAGTYVCQSNASTTTSCTYSNYVMTVTSLTSTTRAASSQIVLLIDGIVNPVTTGSFQSLSLRTTYQGYSDTVDTLTSNLFLTLESRTLSPSNVQLSCTTQQVYTLSTFTFTINNQNSLPANSLVYIRLPPQLTYTSFSCTKGGLGVSCDVATINGVSCVRIALGNSVSIARGAMPVLQISNVYTPPSTKPTSTFQIYLVFSDGTRSQEMLSGITYQATTSTIFSSASITSSSVRNYQSNTVFSMQLSTLFALQNQTRLTIQFPMSTLGSSCQSQTPQLTSMSCTALGQTISAILTMSAAISTVSFNINNMVNYPSLAAFTISLVLKSADNLYDIISQSFSLQNSQPNTITLSYSFSNAIMLEPSTLSVSMTPTTPLQPTDYILMTFPSEFTLSLVSCTTSTQLSCSSPTSQKIKIVTSSIFPSPISLVISGITNPALSTSSSVYVETYTSGGSLKDQDSTITFVRICSAWCRTCSTVNTSSCSTCYTNDSLVSGNTILSNGQCTTTCSSSLQYLNSTSRICFACSTNCTTCLDYSRCTACPATYYLHNEVCLAGCPDGYYPDTLTQRCVACTTALHCQTCSSNLVCLSCAVDGTTTYFLYGTRCYSSCPALITTEDSFARKCQTCPTFCTQCTGTTVVTCTKCQAGYLLDQNACYASCQTANTVVSTDGLTCVGCNSLCLTCSQNQFNCTTCNTASANKYLFNNNCLASCANGYYPNDNLMTCSLCTPPCQTCTSGSVTSCLSCQTNYYLHDTSCLPSCPAQTFQNGSRCSSCQLPCKECSSATICLSCPSNKLLYLQSCLDDCPINTVPINGYCTNCSTSCKTCEASTSLCTSCYTGSYLLNGICQASCPDYYYANDTTERCQTCVHPCSTCSNSTVCKSCVTSWYLQNGVCLAQCTGNKIPVSGICTSCNSSCLTCVGSVTSCTSCQAGFLYNQEEGSCRLGCSTGFVKYSQNNTCLRTCPTSFYDLSGECTVCPTPCSTCISATNCSTCQSGSFYYAQMCYSGCPAVAPYTNGTTCVTCGVGNCQTCSGALCLTCQTGYLNIGRQSCISSCPTNYSYNAASLICQEIPINNTTNNTSNSSGTAVKLSFVPVPYIIASAVVIGVAFLGKFQHKSMLFGPSVLPFVSTFTIAAAITNLVVTMLGTPSWIPSSIDIYLLLGGLGITFLLNQVNMILVCSELRQDAGYKQFLSQHCFGVTIIMMLSTIVSLKWVQLLMSNFFSFKVFKMQLRTEDYLQKYRILQWISLISLIAFIGCGALQALQNSSSTYLFYGGIQLVILSIIDFGLVIASNTGLKAQSEQPYKETMTQPIPYEHRLENQSEMMSQVNIKDVSHETINEHHANNIFELKAKQKEQEIVREEEKRAESAHPIRHGIEIEDNIEYQSALEFDRMDPVKVDKKMIGKAIQEGVFRHNAHSFMEIKKKQEDYSALADAAKMYHFQMKKKMEKDGDEVGVIKQNGVIDNQRSQLTPSPPPEAVIVTPQELRREAQNHEMNMIIFDEAEDQRSVPTFASREASRQQQKRMNSLGSLALIIEQEDAQAGIDHINLDSGRTQQSKKKAKDVQDNIPQRDEQKPVNMKKDSVRKKESLRRHEEDKQQSKQDSEEIIKPDEQHRQQQVHLQHKRSQYERQSPVIDKQAHPKDRSQPKNPINMPSPQPSSLQIQDLESNHEPEDYLLKMDKSPPKFIYESPTGIKNKRKQEEDVPVRDQKKDQKTQKIQVKPLKIEKRKEQSPILPLYDDSAHRDVNEGYQDMTEVESNKLDSSYEASNKKLMPVTLEQQKTALKKKLSHQPKQLSQSPIPIIVKHGSPRRDDLESIYTVQDHDYVQARRTIDFPQGRVTRQTFSPEKRYLDDTTEEDMIRPSQLFKAPKGLRKPQSMSVGGVGIGKTQNTSQLKILPSQRQNVRK